jgi:tetratricopeptide (TPR) repeat protein
MRLLMTGAGDLITLTMIVKDEVHTLARTLRSVRDHVDRWTILDTGSTDGTQALIRAEMAGVPGELHEEPFVDFATSRNRALELAGTATEFVMWLDADDELQGGDALRAFLERERAERGPDREAYFMRVAMGIRFDSPRVFRAQSGWRFRGAVHEILCRPDRPPPSRRIEGATILHDPGTAGVERSKKRWERDVKLLAGALEKDPKDTRAAFYLAQSLLWLERFAEAEKAFQHRVAMGGWVEEIFESQLALARVAAALERPWPEVMARYLAAYATSPHRAEPLHAIAMHWNALGQHALTFLFARRGWELPYPEKDTLFVDESVYAFRCADLVGTSAYWIGEYELGEAAARKAAAAQPDDERLKRNLGYYLERKKQMTPP